MSQRRNAPRSPRRLTRDEIARFEKLDGQLRGLHTEIQTLVKKSPNDTLNAFKVRLVNNVLRAANDFLGDAYEPLVGFTAFDDDALPSNSDAMLVLAQYLSALEHLRADNISEGYEAWYWMIDGAVSDVRTGAPLKIGKR